MRVIAHAIDNCPLVAASLVVAAGWRHEPPGLEGLAHLAEHAHFLGSSRYPEVDAATVPYGAHLDGETHPEATTFEFVCLRDDAAAMLDVLEDVVFAPTFDVDRLAAESEVVRSAMSDESEYTPWELALLELDDLLYQTRAVTSMGTRDSFARIGRRHVLDWQDRHYRRSASTLLLAGDVEQLASLGTTAGSAYAEPSVAPVRRPPKARARHRHQDGLRPELCLGFGFPIDGYSPAMDLLRVLVGNYPSSRLWRALRGDDPAAYMVDADLRVMSDVGRLSLYVGLADVVEPELAWRRLVDVVRGLCSRPPTDGELRWARRVARLEMTRRMLDPERALRFLVSRWPLVGGPHLAATDPYGSLLAGLDAPGSEDIACAARFLLSAGSAALCVVGDVGAWSLDSALAHVDDVCGAAR